MNKQTPSREVDSSRQTKGESLCESIDSPKHVTKASGVNHAVSPAISLNNGREQPKTETKSSQSGSKSCSNTKPNCYKCAYRGGVPGSAHSTCRHPDIAPLLDNPLMEILSIMGGSRIGDMSMMFNSVYKLLNISGNEHGKRNGWFNWPVNFDPVWLESCDGFKENKNE